MEHHTPTPTETDKPSPRRLGLVAGAGIIAGLIAVVVGGVASAQSGGMTVIAQTDEPVVVESDGGEDEIWAAFEQCLVDAGLDVEALEDAEETDDFSAFDEEAIDAVFESCEPILDDLSDDAYFELEGCDDELDDDDEEEDGDE